MWTRVARILPILGLCLPLGCLRLDSFMFSPVGTDEYLRPEDMKAEWGVDFIIPESLYTEIELVSSGGNRIYGFLVDPGTGTPRDEVTVIYFHGNSDNINRYWGHVELLWQMGYRVFIIDFQGYGKSEGSPSGEACFADGRAALEYVLVHPGVNPERVVFYGMSMGSFVTTYLAADSVTPLCVILVSAPASASAITKEGTVFDLPASCLTELDFDNESRIGRIECPVLLMHGKDDSYLLLKRHPFRLVEAAEKGGTDLAVEWVEGAGHDDVAETLGERFSEVITWFIGRAVKKQQW
jgi:pimeloyl-ACP methyl ester carboxylesterase